MTDKKNILIVGNTITSVALVKKLRAYGNCGEIFVTGLRNGMPDYVHMLDIREDSISELLEFVLEQSINLTIVLSPKALKADIAGIFSANGQMIFAPDSESVKQIIDEAATKKFLYKLKVPTSRFGVFEKAQLALDYIKTAKFPLIIKNSEPFSERDLFACPTVSVANIAINDLFFKNENKIIIEEYNHGHKFTLYVVTDGYKALPLGVVSTHKFSDAEDGGYLTKGSASSMPDFKITKALENDIMKDVVVRLLNALESSGHPYNGILGFRCLKTDDKLFVESISSFVDDSDAQVLFNSIDENLITLFEACAMGVFADDYEDIKTNDLASVSLTIFSRYENKSIEGIERLDNPDNLNLCVCNSKTKKGAIATITASANTLARAKTKLADEIGCIYFEGMKFRKDIIC